MSLRLVLAAAALVATTRPAAADGFYFLEGFGGSKYADQLGDYVDGGGVNIRAALGRRWDNLAVEVWFRGELTFDRTLGAYPERPGGSGGGYGFGDGMAAYGIDLKVLQPVSKHWSLYARGGLSRMIADEASYAGRGIGATAGIQVAGRVPALGYLWWPLFFLAKNVGPKVHSGLWFEASHSFYRLHGGGPSIDARITSWTLGFSVGQDF
jgi:hypothetical protein